MFTAEEAFEASEDGEPIMLDRAAAFRLVVREHDGDWSYFLRDTQPGAVDFQPVDAAVALRWLGY